ncbi:MAG: L,D-transpeptidase [Proteobacteria bacterium]|nr:L,D-transpeptidase [Pseudomonadota bacterium]
MTVKRTVLSVSPLVLALALSACNGADQENAADRDGPQSAGAPAPAAAGTTAPAGPDGVQPMDPGAVDAASFSTDAASTSDRSPAILRAQVLLDRARFSPGVIDGTMGENVRQAIAAFERANDLPVDGQLDEAVFNKLTQLDNRPALAEYTIAEQDLRGPFVETIPDDLEAQGRLPVLAYTSPLELLAERFHMTEEALQALNPNVDFRRAGQTIRVAALAPDQLPGAVTLIEVDKAERAVRVYAEGRKLLAFYPATIGSSVLPTPGGEMAVKGVAPEPTYTFDPKKINSGAADKVVKVAAGPNNPVGSVWIDLTKETYGIHGTPEPRFIGKTASSGCVRLTNWDAEELAAQVKPGVRVVFLEQSKPI